MGKVLTNIKNVGIIKEISPPTYSGSKNSQIIDIENIISKNNIQINAENYLSPYYIKNNISIWNTVGKFNTATNSGDYGSIYFNYDNKKKNNLFSFTNLTQSQTTNMTGIRPNFCGKILRSYSSETESIYIIGAYGDFIYLASGPKLIKYNSLSCEIIWTSNLNSYLDSGSISSRAKLFFVNNILFLFTSNNSSQSAKIFTISQTNGSVISSKYVGDVPAVSGIDMDASVDGDNCDIYLFVWSGTNVYFEHAKYTTSGSFVSSSSSGNQLVYGGGFWNATFDKNHNCIVSNSGTRNSNFYIFNASDASVYYYNSSDIFNKLEYSDENSAISFMIINFEAKILTCVYKYNTNDSAYAVFSFTNSGITGDATVQQTLEGIGIMYSVSLTRVKNMDVDDILVNHYYVTSDKFFITLRFQDHGVVDIINTERFSYERFGTSSYFNQIIINPLSNIVYHNQNGIQAFRDNQYGNILYSMLIDSQ